MKIESILNIAIEQYEFIIDSNSLKENLLSEFFRKNKFIGSKERKLIQEISYAALRHHLTITDFLKTFPQFNTTINKALVSLILTELFFSNSLKNVIINAQKLYKIKNKYDYFFEFIADSLVINTNEIIEILNKYFNSIPPDSIEESVNIYSFPSFLYDSLKSTDIKTKKLIAKSYLKQNNFTIRTNLLKSTPEETASYLSDLQISYRKSDMFDDGFIINERTSLLTDEYYKKGFFEIQDEASMFVANAINPNNDSKILDACAGAGGKALHLASITKNKNMIYAYDINQYKLKELQKRKKRNKASSILIINKNHLKKNHFDYILIDAPCSGSGTLRNNPALKYKINEEMIEKYQSLQLSILDVYSKLLKPGGKLIYSTCSILPKENLEVISKFLSENDNFEPYPLPDKHFSKFKINSNSNEISIFPYELNSDGFYICKLIKSK